MNNDIIWQTKLAARIHDPAEKALVLLRDPAGWIACGFGSGLSPRAPGTAGSLAALLP